MAWLVTALFAFGSPQVDVPPDGGGGCKCNQAAAPALAWAPLLVAGAVLARRRR